MQRRREDPGQKNQNRYGPVSLIDEFLHPGDDVLRLDPAGDVETQDWVGIGQQEREESRDRKSHRGLQGLLADVFQNRRATPGTTQFLTRRGFPLQARSLAIGAGDPCCDFVNTTGTYPGIMESVGQEIRIE